MLVFFFATALDIPNILNKPKAHIVEVNKNSQIRKLRFNTTKTF